MTQSQHIMIVDDEAPARDMVGDYLKMHGFTVTLCDGGKSLRAAIESSVPDLVVLDLNMPEEDGLSIIRDLKSRINVPVIMLTATASPIDRVVGLELGADDYIAKPCELREFMARIRSVLRRSPPVRPPEHGSATATAKAKEIVRFGTKWMDVDVTAVEMVDILPANMSALTHCSARRGHLHHRAQTSRNAGSLTICLAKRRRRGDYGEPVMHNFIAITAAARQVIIAAQAASN